MKQRPEKSWATEAAPRRPLRTGVDRVVHADAETVHALLGDGHPDDWRELALCAQTDPEVFFPEEGGSTREAKRVCAACPVQPECLEYALARDERYGVWGGASRQDRLRMRRQS